ncbi:hypothetical protein EDD94_5381 [Streptomyces sp. PanSC9]|nr:hypothetical protein EDD94_5381 [Streptomyces sp. PanSC9]
MCACSSFDAADRRSVAHPAEKGLAVKSTVAMRKKAGTKKIAVRRTGDVRLTSAACQCPYSVQA